MTGSEQRPGPPHQGDEPPAANMRRIVEGGVAIYVDASDERGQRMIECGGSFNPPAVHMWQSVLARGDWTHVVDIGANYGEMLVGVDLPPRAKVFAVEPNPRVLPYLRRTLREATLDVEIVAKAVAAHSGTVSLLVDKQWSGTTRLAHRGETLGDRRYELIEVAATTLAALLDDGGGGIRAAVKIDVEGHEPEILRGVAPILHRLGRFEAMAEIAIMSDDELRAIFAEYDVEVLDLASEQLVPLTPKTPERLRELIEAGRCYKFDAVLIPVACG